LDSRQFKALTKEFVHPRVVRLGMLSANPHPRQVTGQSMEPKRDEHALLAGHLPVASDLLLEGSFRRHGSAALAFPLGGRLYRRLLPWKPKSSPVGFVKPHLAFCAPKRYWDFYDRDAFELAPRQTPPEGAPPNAPQFGGELRQYSGVSASGPIPDDLQSIPILVVAPGIIRPGSRTGAMVETVDLYPTLCDLAALPLPVGQGHFDGQSLVPVLKDPKARHKDAIVHVYPRHPRNRGMLLGRAVRTERIGSWNGNRPAPTRIPPSSNSTIIRRTPMETQNFAPSRPEVVADLRSILARLPEAQPQVTTPARP